MPDRPPDPPEDIHEEMLRHLSEHPPRRPEAGEEEAQVPARKPAPEAPAKPADPPRLMLRRLRYELALERLETFVRFHARRGTPEVVVVVGKGRNSPGGTPVLGPAVERELRGDARVAAVEPAPLRLGGDGALLVRLADG